MALQTAAKRRGGEVGKTLDYLGGGARREPRLMGGDILAPAFAMTGGAWITAYLSRMPMVNPPLDGRVTIGMMLGAVVVVGIFAGRYSRKGAVAGLLAGMVSGVLDLLILGSLLYDDVPAGNRVPEAVLWIVGSIAINGAAGFLGGLAGRILRGGRRAETDFRWTAVLAGVMAAATLPLLTAGGLVTAFHAGLAVPDWPQSYGYNMFLFPLSRMQSVQGNFYEHAHRLMGAFVGLTAITVGVYFTLADWRGWRGLLAKWNWRVWMAWGLLLAVCVQGALGGTRVTEKSETLAIVHGIFAQIVFAGMVLLAGVSTRSFERAGGGGGERGREGEGRTDRALTAWLLAAMLVQLTLGAVVRHLNMLVIVHVSMAAVVAILALAAGFRSMWIGEGASGGRRLAGGAVLVLVGLQVVLGIVALALLPAVGNGPDDAEAIWTTAHQANGALLLAAVVILFVWTWRRRDAAAEGAG